MLCAIGSVLRLLIILKAILTLEKSCNIYHWTKVCGLICWEKQRSQQQFFSSKRGECTNEKKIAKCTGHDLDASFF